MMSSFGSRTGISLALVLAAAGAAWLLVHDVTTVSLVAVIGSGAVLLSGSRLARPLAALPDPDAERQPPLDDIADAIEAPILLIDGRRVTMANQAARRLLGDHIVDQDVRVAIRHPAAVERLAGAERDDRPVQLVGLGSRDQHWEMRIRRLGGDICLLHLIDRTDARAADRIRVDFVANASHELRTPLAALLGFIETLQDEAGEDPAIRARFLSVMQGEAARMDRLIDDLMSLSRIEAEKFRLPDTVVDLAPLAQEVRADLAVASPQRGGDIVLNAAPADVIGDRAQLSQLLHNIIGNAMKYGHAGTPITVTVGTAEANSIRLSVADQSEGIAPEHLPRLTERFYRVDPGRSRAVGGTGLGLAIVKHIVERHRGRLEMTSAQGRGTTVTVLLPSAGAKATS